jgi:hypothetical protein
MSTLEEEYQSVLQRLVRETESLKKRVRELEADIPLFDVSNEFTPDTLSATENDYDPGNYDIIRLTLAQDSTITGISGGKKGRYLELYNAAGGFLLTIPSESTGSVEADRVVTPSGQDIVVFPKARAKLYYDAVIERWVVPDLPQWAGRHGQGIWAFVTPQAGSSQSIPDDVLTQVTIDTVFLDDWGMFDSANNRVVIPDRLPGIYLGSFGGFWASHATGGNLRHLEWQINGVTSSSSALSVPSIASRVTHMSAPLNKPLFSGNVVTWHARQKSGGALDFKIMNVILTKIR